MDYRAEAVPLIAQSRHGETNKIHRMRHFLSSCAIDVAEREVAPPALLRYKALTRYVPAGDFASVLTYGIGVGRPSSTHLPTPVRIYEVEKIEQGQLLFIAGPTVTCSFTCVSSPPIPEHAYGITKLRYWWLLPSPARLPPRLINVYVIEHANGLVVFDTGHHPRVGHRPLVLSRRLASVASS